MLDFLWSWLFPSFAKRLARWSNQNWKFIAMYNDPYTPEWKLDAIRLQFKGDPYFAALAPHMDRARMEVSP
jgi:hypothetical protein